MIKRILVGTLFLFSLFLVFSTIPVSAAEVVTAPVTFFSVKGKVTLRNVLRPLSSILPGANVTITLKNVLNQNQKTTVMTDSNGEYMANVVPGLYFVEATSSSSSFFNPPLQVVRVVAGQERTVNFQGLLFNL